MVPKTFHLRERRLNPLQDWISEELLNPGLEAAMRPMRLDGLSEEQLSNHYVELAQGKQFELVKVYCQTILSAFGDVEIALIAIADSLERERLQQIVLTVREKPSGWPRRGCARAPSTSSPCCRLSRPCSRPRTSRWWRGLRACRRC
jgi:hypothetical protein